MPSALHECPGQWIIDEIADALVRRIIPPVWIRKIGICASPEYKSFTGEYKQCTKEADLTIIPRLSPDWYKEAQYPSVVLESGWTEPAQQLDHDASLWLAGSGGQVRVVVQVKFYRQQDRIGARMWIKRARPTYNNSFKTSTETYEILLPAVDPVENPSITFEEFFAGGCPLRLDPKGSVILNLENLRILARMRIINRGNVPDE
ncbi:hypothetical protein HOY82DRAFT_251356 [Tuber indicum]|nr:hypothetical protein HOY82DRAFT_251356 [Tuber indicum]